MPVLADYQLCAEGMPGLVRDTGSQPPSDDELSDDECEVLTKRGVSLEPCYMQASVPRHAAPWATAALAIGSQFDCCRES